MGGMSATSSESDSVPWSQWVGMAVLMSAIFAGLEFMVYRSLAPLERGEPQAMAVWEPIAIVYELCGYSAAMSIIPSMWACMMGIIAWQTWARVRRSSESSGKGIAPN
jgi:hypothetical protein